MPASDTNVAGEQPATVWAPLEPQIAIAVAVDILAVQNGAHLLRRKIHDAQVGTIFEEGNLLAIRTILGLHRHLVALGQALLRDIGGIGKLLLVLVLNGRTVNLPHAITL